MLNAMASLSNTTTFTNEPSKESDWGVLQYKETTPLHVFRLSCFTVIVIAGLIGNYLVCKVTWKTPLRNPFSFHLVANMAFAEIPNCLCVLILLISQYEGGHRDSIVHDICVTHHIYLVKTRTSKHKNMDVLLCVNDSCGLNNCLR